MQLAETLAERRLSNVLAALSERVGEQELVAFVINKEVTITLIGEHNPWFIEMQSMKAAGKICRRVFNEKIDDHMFMIVGPNVSRIQKNLCNRYAG